MIPLVLVDDNQLESVNLEKMQGRNSFVSKVFPVILLDIFIILCKRNFKGERLSENQLWTRLISKALETSAWKANVGYI